jgi:putative membrane protein
MLRAGAGVGATTLALLSAPLALAATDGDVVVTNTETVQVYLDADGEIDTQRVYEQLVLTGTGDVSLENPIETDGLRNLDGFSGYDVEDGKAVLTESVDGEERFRSVSDFDGELPLDVSIAYFLDGEQVEAGDVVGEDGELDVVYRVENMTARTQTVEVADGKGGTVSTDIDVVLPMVGSLSTVLPSSFTDVESEQANMAGDGRGGTKMSFTMTLFPPIGKPVAEFGYTATISDGVVPDATISALPVNPLESSSFKGGAASYEGGADTGAELTAGAAEIDSNLLKLRDGAADLSLGLIKLYDGASELEEGLNGDAVPGAEQLYDGSLELADGTERLSDGLDELDSGATQLDDGAAELSDGADALSDGATELERGAGELSEGAGDLRAGADELDQGARRLDGGANRLADGLAEADGKAPALVGGLEQVRDGLLLVDDGLAQMYAEVNGSRQKFSAGIQQMIRGIGSTADAPGSSLLGTLGAVRGGLQDAAGQLEDPIRAQLPCAVALLDEMATGASAPTQCRAGVPVGPGQVVNPDPQIQAVQRAYLASLRDGTRGLLGGLTDLHDGLTNQQTGAIVALTGVMCGLDSTTHPMCGPITGGKPGLLQGINQLDAGITELIDGVTRGIGHGDDTPADRTLRGGVNGLQDGTDQLLGGVQALVDGLDLLAAGADDLATGTGELADGTQLLSDGSVRLADGTQILADGTVRLADGAEQLSDGSIRLGDGTGRLVDGAGRLVDGGAELSDGSEQLSGGLDQLYQGLLTAADGTGQLRGGLQQAKAGAPKLEDGASKLSEQGTQKLVQAGSDTAVTYGEGYAMLTAGAERAETESMAYGAPEGAQGVTAYTYEIRGEDGESSRNWGRGLAALAIFAAGTGVVMWRRSLS